MAVIQKLFGIKPSPLSVICIHIMALSFALITTMLLESNTLRYLPTGQLLIVFLETSIPVLLLNSLTGYIYHGRIKYFDKESLDSWTVSGILSIINFMVPLFLAILFGLNFKTTMILVMGISLLTLLLIVFRRLKSGSL